MFDPIFIKVLLGTLLLAASSSVVGAFSFLKGESLVGDAIAHALLPEWFLHLYWATAETRCFSFLALGGRAYCPLWN
jgi:ABC-type Mn2+/Zn2+ transport system permease subunit